MKPFALLIVGVVVGWAASGVDWSRAAVGQEAPDAVPPLPSDPLMPEASLPQPNRALIADPTSGVSPRRIYESRIGTDPNGNPQINSETRFVYEKGENLPKPGTMLVGRFQASAYGTPNGHGCYVVDTTTGRTWHLLNGHPPLVVAEALGVQTRPMPDMPPSILPKPVPPGDIDLSLP